MTTQSNTDREVDNIWEELCYTASSPIQGRQPYTFPELKEQLKSLMLNREAALLSRIKEETIGADEPNMYDTFGFTLEKLGRNQLRAEQRTTLDTIKAEIEGNAE
jgi:hypothetical protein